MATQPVSVVCHRLAVLISLVGTCHAVAVSVASGAMRSWEQPSGGPTRPANGAREAADLTAPEPATSAKVEAARAAEVASGVRVVLAPVRLNCTPGVDPSAAAWRYGSKPSQALAGSFVGDRQLASLTGLTVQLRRAVGPGGTVYFDRPDAPGAGGGELRAISLAELQAGRLEGEAPQNAQPMLSIGAIYHIADSIGRHLIEKEGVVGIEVVPEGIDRQNGDRRTDAGKAALTFAVVAADIFPPAGMKQVYRVGNGSEPVGAMPTLEKLREVPVTLLKRGDVYVGPQSLDWKLFVESAGVTTETRTIGQWSDSNDQLHMSAYAAIAGATADAINAAGVYAVAVAPPSRDGKAPVMTIDVGRVARVNVVGGKPPANTPIDFRDLGAAHQRIAAGSPVKATSDGGTGLVDRDALESYVQATRRRGVRDVSVAIGPGENPRELTLDYLVTELKPWSVYAQVQNTGTSATTEWRERIGFLNNDVSGVEDSLKLDYSTADFDLSHAVTASYERPLADRLYGRVYGSWSKFTAADVGFSGRSFEGESADVGLELRYNFLQKQEWFFDALGGVRYQHVEATDRILGTETVTGSGFLYPYIGVTADARTDRATTNLSAILEFQTGGVGTDNATDLAGLGRQDPSTSWTTLNLSAEHAFYFEPLFDSCFTGRNLPDGVNWQPGMSLAHELALSARSQIAFGDRLIPNAMSTLGGLYTVRGYPEAVVAGDTSVFGTIEYRFHVPQAMRPDAAQRGFRWVPQQTYGRADWDLVLKAFVDGGRVIQNDLQAASERNATLLSTGLGVETQFSDLFGTGLRGSIRADWGVALYGIKDAANNVVVDNGDNRFHFSFTIVY